MIQTLDCVYCSELEADKKVAVILSETLLEDVMIFMYQIHLI